MHFSYDDLRGANFSGTRMSVVIANQSMGLLRSEFKGANLEGANFSAPVSGTSPLNTPN